MRIRWVLEDGDRPGGVETVARALVDGLGARGHDAAVVSWFAEAGTTFGSSPVAWLRGKLSRARARAVAARRVAEQLQRQLNDDPELVVLLDPGSLAVASNMGGLPRWGIHLHWSPDLLLRPWRHVSGDGVPRLLKPLVHLRLRQVASRNRKILASAPFVVTLTPSHTRALRDVRDRVVELPNPARLTPAGVRPLRSGAIVIGFLGRLSHEKGPDIFLAAAARLSNQPELEWVIGGAGPEEDELRRQAAEIPASVRFAGWISDPQEFLSSVDVFALTSRTEAVPLVLAEALVAGCRVVASEAGEGVADVLEDGRLGRVVPVGDVAALADALRAAATEAREGRRSDDDALARLIRRHDPSSVLTGWEVLMQSATGRGLGPS